MRRHRVMSWISPTPPPPLPTPPPPSHTHTPPNARKILSRHLVIWSRKDNHSTTRTLLKYMRHLEESHETINPLQTIWIHPHYLLEESNFNFRFVRLWALDIPREKWLHYLRKQWRPWSDVAFCGVWSGYALFAKYPFRGLQTTMG